jgi:hypothetical protein
MHKYLLRLIEKKMLITDDNDALYHGHLILEGMALRYTTRGINMMYSGIIKRLPYDKVIKFMILITNIYYCVSN